MKDQAHEWHQKYGATLFNRSWELIERADRTADEDAEMLLAAATSRWHWGQIGGPEEITGGDWQVAHVSSLLGFGDLARFFAERNLRVATDEQWDGWRLASAHEGMARACSAAGDVDGRERHLARAQEALDREPDDENRQVIAEQLASVPEIS